MLDPMSRRQALALGTAVFAVCGGRPDSEAAKEREPIMKTIGVLGGLGPQATMDFEARVHRVAQRLIPADRNGGYPPMVVYYCRHPPVLLTDRGTPQIPF